MVTRLPSTSSGSETSRKEPDNLPDPHVLAQEIVEDLKAALEQFRESASDLGMHQADHY